MFAGLTLLLSGCTPQVRIPAFEMQPGYLESLRGADDLAHGTAEEPPRATLASSAHAAALLRSRGESVAVDPSFWKGLVAPSGEDAGWVAYYACLAGADQVKIEQILGTSVASFLPEVQGADEMSHPMSGNDALASRFHEGGV